MCRGFAICELFYFKKNEGQGRMVYASESFTHTHSTGTSDGSQKYEEAMEDNERMEQKIQQVHIFRTNEDSFHPRSNSCGKEQCFMYGSKNNNNKIKENTTENLQQVHLKEKSKKLTATNTS